MIGLYLELLALIAVGYYLLTLVCEKKTNIDPKIKRSLQSQVIA